MTVRGARGKGAPLRSAVKSAMQARVPALRKRNEKIAQLQGALEKSRRRVDRLRRRVRALENQAHALEIRAIGLESHIKSLDEAALQRVRDEEESRKRNRQREKKPSFYREILSLRNSIHVFAEVDPGRRTVIRQIPFKLRNYSLAQSHGIRAPEIYGVWPAAEAINLDGLPDRFVLKSDGGSSSRGVFPLRRVGQDSYVVAGTAQTYSNVELKEQLGLWHSRGQVRSPFFAEEFLIPATSDEVIPSDIKVFTFYGEVGHVMIRTVGAHGRSNSYRFRFLAADGTDLGDVSLARRAIIDPEIAVPERFDEIIDVVGHLSRCVGTPFMRVDMYDTVEGLRVGELTRSPGAHISYQTEHDQRLGDMWLHAQARLEQDLIDGRPPGVLFGEHPAADYYRDPDLSVENGPESWPKRQFPCSRWCIAAG